MTADMADFDLVEVATAVVSGAIQNAYVLFRNPRQGGTPLMPSEYDAIAALVVENVKPVFDDFAAAALSSAVTSRDAALAAIQDAPHDPRERCGGGVYHWNPCVCWKAPFDRTAPTTAAQPQRRLRACVETWPECREGDYDPRCCRFPKSCSCTIYDEATVTDDDLEPAAATTPEGEVHYGCDALTYTHKASECPAARTAANCACTDAWLYNVGDHALNCPAAATTPEGDRT